MSRTKELKQFIPLALWLAFGYFLIIIGTSVTSGSQTIYFICVTLVILGFLMVMLPAAFMLWDILDKLRRRRRKRHG